MPYSEDFYNLLDYTPNDYIGFGNPNARILFLCQETDIDGDETYPGIFENDIINNAQRWRLLARDAEYTRQFNNTCINSQNTSSTDICQRILNAIFDSKAENTYHFDLHKFSFYTHLCNLTYKAIRLSDDMNSDKCRQAMLLRTKNLSNDFFRYFNIVIAPLGHFPRLLYGDQYFGDVFGVDFCGNEGLNEYEWMNVCKRLDDKHPMLLIHTEHLRKSSVYNDSFIAHIANTIVEFAKEKEISLLPPAKLIF